MIFHIVRNSLNFSLFQELIQLCLHDNFGDTFYISSGFFQEKNNFYVSTHQDTFQRSFTNNVNAKNQTINTQGVYNNMWMSQYNHFVNNLKLYGYTVNKFHSNRNHSKVFLCYKNKKPILEIIGSSNFTSTAYGINHPKKYFNHEADLVIVLDTETDLINKVREILKFHKLDAKVMYLDYSKENKVELLEQMEEIKNMIFK